MDKKVLYTKYERSRILNGDDWKRFHPMQPARMGAAANPPDRAAVDLARITRKLIGRFQNERQARRRDETQCARTRLTATKVSLPQVAPPMTS